MTSVVLSAPHVESTANIPLSRVTTAYPAAAVSLTEFHCDVPQNQLAYLAPNRFSVGRKKSVVMPSIVCVSFTLLNRRYLLNVIYQCSIAVGLRSCLSLR